MIINHMVIHTGVMYKEEDINLICTTPRQTYDFGFFVHIVGQEFQMLQMSLFLRRTTDNGITKLHRELIAPDTVTGLGDENIVLLGNIDIKYPQSMICEMLPAVRRGMLYEDGGYILFEADADTSDSRILFEG